MTAEIKAFVLLLIGVTIAALIYLSWDEKERLNKLIADIIGTVAAILYLFVDKTAGLIILAVSAVAIVLVIVFMKKTKESIEDLYTDEEPVAPVEEELDEFEPAPEEHAGETEPEPKEEHVEETEEETDEEPVQERIGEQLNTLSDNLKDEPREMSSDKELIEPSVEDEEMHEEELNESAPEEKVPGKTVEYSDGVIGAPVKKEEEPEEAPEQAGQDAQPDDKLTHEQYIIEKLSDSSAQRNAGINLKEQGKTDEAIEKLNEAIRINPEDFKAHSFLANIFKEKGLLEESAEEYKKVISINPKVAEAHYALGFDYSSKGEIKDAISSFENFIKYASPKEEELKNEVERMIEHLKEQLEAS